VWGIVEEFFLLDLMEIFMEKFSLMREYFLGPCAHLRVSKGQRLNENFLGGCLDEGHRFWSKFQLFFHYWGRASSYLWFL
jgi:hypothetical protein